MGLTLNWPTAVAAGVWDAAAVWRPATVFQTSVTAA